MFGSSSTSGGNANGSGLLASSPGNHSTVAQYGSPSSSSTSPPLLSNTQSLRPGSLPKSGIALTRRTAAAAATQQRGIGNSTPPTSGNGNGNGHTDIHSAAEDSIAIEDEDDEEQAEYSSSPGGTKTIRRASSGAAASNSLGLAGVTSKPKLSSTTSSKKPSDKLLRCERCHKVYHHPQSLIKHRWQHTEIWSDASRYGLSKHQTVQALEAAVILANPDTLRLLPNDKSHWPAAVSPPTSGLLGSERVNIEVLRKQAEINERELDEQEKAGNLRAAPPMSSRKSASAVNSMQMYSKSMPANVGRRRSGLAFSLHNDMMDDDEDDEDEDDDDNDNDGIKDDATMATETTTDERGDDGGDEDDDSTESEDEAGIMSGGSHAMKGASVELDSMDQDMFSLDISSNSPYARPSPLPPVAENGNGQVPTSTRSGLSYSRKNYTTSLVAPLAERYTFLPTIPSSSSLHISDNMSSGSMTAIPSASIRTRNRSSSHTRSTRGFDQQYASHEERGIRENSTSSSTDESGVSASASIGAATTGGSGDDESLSFAATKDSGYISNLHEMVPHAEQQQGPANQTSATSTTTPVKPAIDPAQTGAISMSAPVLGFFTERSPVSSFTATRGPGAPPTRQQAIHASPRFGPIDHSGVKAEHNDSMNGSIAAGPQAIPGYTPLEAQAAEILSSSHQSQSGPRSFSQTHFGSSYARSPGFHPYRATSPFPSSRQLPSSSLSGTQHISSNIHSSSPSTATGQAYSFGQAPLGTSYRSTSFNLASPAPGPHKQFPMSPLARPADTSTGGDHEDEDEIMDMDL